MVFGAPMRLGGKVLGILSSKLSGITNNLTNTGGTLNNQFLSSQLFQLDGELGGVKLVGFGVPGMWLEKVPKIFSQMVV